MAVTILFICSGVCVLAAVQEQRDPMRSSGCVLLSILLALVGVIVHCNH